MVELALATGISPSAWADESPEAIATALQILNDRKD